MKKPSKRSLLHVKQPQLGHTAVVLQLLWLGMQHHSHSVVAYQCGDSKVNGSKRLQKGNLAVGELVAVGISDKGCGTIWKLHICNDQLIQPHPIVSPEFPLITAHFLEQVVGFFSVMF